MFPTPLIVSALIGALGGEIAKDVGTRAAVKLLRRGWAKIVQRITGDSLEKRIRRVLDTTEAKYPGSRIKVMERFRKPVNLIGKSIDRDSFVDLLPEVGTEAAGYLFDQLHEEFSTLLEKAMKDEATFREVVIVLFDQLRNCIDNIPPQEHSPDLQVIRKAIDTVSRTISAQLLEIGRKVDEIYYEMKRQSQITLLIPITVYLSKPRPGERREPTFLRETGAEWVDFEHSYIIKRDEVDRILDGFEINQVQIVWGSPASGKTTIARYVGYRLAWDPENLVYMCRADRLSQERVAITSEIKSLVDGNRAIYLIVEDAHLAPDQVNALYFSIRETGCHLIITSRPLLPAISEQVRYPNECVQTNVDNTLDQAAAEIIRNYLSLKYGIEPSPHEISKIIQLSGQNLWYLIYLLESRGEDGTFDYTEVYRRINRKLRRLDVEVEKAASTILALTPLSKFEISMQIAFLVDVLKVTPNTITYLTRLGEVRHNERESTLALPHSALAELYLETAEVYQTLTETNTVLMRQRYDLPTDMPYEDLTIQAYLLFLPDKESNRLYEVLTKPRIEEEQLREYQGIPLILHEVQILQKLEHLIGESILHVDEIDTATFGFRAKDNHVIELGLSEKGLVVLPEGISKLTNLKTINLRENRLTALPEEGIEDLMNLEILDLSGNQLKALPESMMRLTKLGYLNLSYNPELGAKAIEVGSNNCTDEDRKNVQQFLAQLFQIKRRVRLRRPSTPDEAYDYLIVTSFFDELCNRAIYGVQGEKPVLMIAILQYAHTYEVIGKNLLELLEEPHLARIKMNFIGLAKKYSLLNNPYQSWNQIIGKNEIQKQLDNKYANEAFAKLNIFQINKLYETFLNRLRGIKIPVAKQDELKPKPKGRPRMKNVQQLIDPIFELIRIISTVESRTQKTYNLTRLQQIRNRLKNNKISYSDINFVKRLLEQYKIWDKHKNLFGS